MNIENTNIAIEFDKMLKESTNGYVVSWHLSARLNIKTSQVTAALHKLVKLGVLHFVSTRYCTMFYPAGTTPEIPHTNMLLNTSDSRRKNLPTK